MAFLSRIFGKKDVANQDIVVVSGLPRSGTSMMMKMLEAGGLEPLVDNIRTPDEDNPKGYYEFERVKAMDKGDTAWLPEAQGKVVKVISALLKHLPADHHYKVIFMIRKLDENLASQKKMLERRGKPTDQVADDELRGLLEKHLVMVRRWLDAQPNIDVYYPKYHEVVKDPQGHAEQVNAFLGNRLDVNAMAKIADRSLYRNK